MILAQVISLALAVSLLVSHDEGISGYSGKQGQICNQCHNGGTTPTVALTGPSTLMPGESAQYTFTVTGGAAVRAGFNVAEAGGATFTPGTAQKLLMGELTHSSPHAFDGGSSVFEFGVTAPDDAGILVLFAAGNSTNNDGHDEGDKAASTMMTVTVQSPPPVAVDAGTPPVDPVDAGTMTTAPPTVVDSGTQAPAPTAPPMTPSTPPSVASNAEDIEGGCSTAASTPLLALALMGLALGRRRRA